MAALKHARHRSVARRPQSAMLGWRLAAALDPGTELPLYSPVLRPTVCKSKVIVGSHSFSISGLELRDYDAPTNQIQNGKDGKDRRLSMAGFNNMAARLFFH